MYTRPGTMSGLIFRIVQCLVAATSAVVMASASKFWINTTTGYLVFAMGIQFIWTFKLCCIDILTLIRWRMNLYSRSYLILICVCDWAIGLLCLGTSCASAAEVDSLHKYGFCYNVYMPCNTYRISIAMAFIASFCIYISALVMLRVVM